MHGCDIPLPIAAMARVPGRNYSADTTTGEEEVCDLHLTQLDMDLWGGNVESENFAHKIVCVTNMEPDDEQRERSKCNHQFDNPCKDSKTSSEVADPSHVGRQEHCGWTEGKMRIRTRR